MSPRAHVDTTVFLGCVERCGCSTCGGLLLLDSRLHGQELSSPGYIEALLLEAGRTASRRQLTTGRITHTFERLKSAAQKRVLDAWTDIARTSPEDGAVILSWMGHLSGPIDQDLDDVIRQALPYLLASDDGKEVLESLSRLDPDSQVLATMRVALSTVGLIEWQAYSDRNAGERRVREGLRSLPFMQRLHIMRLIGGDARGMFNDTIPEDELNSMAPPEVQQAIDFLLKNHGGRGDAPLEQLLCRRRHLQESVRHDIEGALADLEPVTQLALILHSDRIPLAILPPSLSSRRVVDALPRALRKKLTVRAAESTMRWWRRHATTKAE